jgi:4-alpha-glucanotransferase
LFWIAPGEGPQNGAYVRYPSEELRAVIALEAARAGTVVIGEDLGTVSRDIRHAMDRDGMLHSFVYQFSASAKKPFPQPDKPAAASLGSHDLPRFATFWRGHDVDERHADGWIDAEAAKQDHEDRERLVSMVLSHSPGTGRQPDGDRELDPASDGAVRAGMTAVLTSLAEGSASYVMVDLADLELQTVPDNRPGTGPEADNWRHRLPRPCDEVAGDGSIEKLMSEVVARRSTAQPEGAGA